jgi:hypothetical protein
MAATILATAGFAERTPAEIQQEENGVVLIQIVICLVVFACVIAVWQFLFRRSLQSRQVSLRSLFVLVGMVSAAIPFLVWTHRLLRMVFFLG